jgi:hypothetical protein
MDAIVIFIVPPVNKAAVNWGIVIVNFHAVFPDLHQNIATV